MISVTGAISEYSGGLTEMSNLTNVTVISSGNPIPPAHYLTTHAFTTPSEIEPWEGSLVRIEEVNATSTPVGQYYEWYVNDGSGSAQVDDGFLVTFAGVVPYPASGQHWAMIQGMVDYSHNEYSINPRFPADMIQTISLGNAQITLPTIQGYQNGTVDMPITTSQLYDTFNTNSFSFDLAYNPLMVELESVETDNTILSRFGNVDSLSYTAGVHSGLFHFDYQAADSILISEDEGDTLLILRFKVRGLGEFPISISNFKYNTFTLNNVTSGKIFVKPTSKASLNIYRVNRDGSITKKNTYIEPLLI
jgi:hypothetical protein